MLRGLYERVVTLGNIADNPNQAEPFLKYYHIHKGKMINHAGKIFDLEKDSEAEELAAVKENYRKDKDKFQVDDCKKCGLTQNKINSFEIRKYNKGIHSDPKILAAFGPGDARR